MYQFFQLVFLFSPQYQPPQFRHDSERLGYDSLVIILQTLSNILFQYPKDSARYEEAMNVKLLLREICQFMGELDVMMEFDGDLI